MLSDLAEVIRNTERPLTEVSLQMESLCVCVCVQLMYMHRYYSLYDYFTCIIVQAQVKSYMTMLLKGVTYLHSKSIMHRVFSFRSVNFFN